MDKKIFFVTITMNGGGTERVIAILANRFIELGYQVSIMMIAGNGVEYELNPQIQIMHISNPSNGSLIERMKRVSKMRKVFKDNHEAVIYGMGTVAAMFTLVATLGLRNNIIVSERNDPNRVNLKPITKSVRFIRNVLYRRAKKLVFQTEDAKKCFPEAIQKKSVVIFNPLDKGIIDAYEGIRENTIVTAGRLTAQKNHMMLINVFAEFVKQYPDYQLKIYGVGELKETLQNRINELGLQDKAELCGFCEYLHEEIRKSGMYVSSSDWEGISNSLVEALALGIPTIATDCPVGGSRTCVKDGVNGFLIPVNSPEILLDRMCKLATDEELKRRFSKEAVRVRKEFGVEKIADEWRNL